MTTWEFQVKEVESSSDEGSFLVEMEDGFEPQSIEELQALSEALAGKRRFRVVFARRV